MSPFVTTWMDLESIVLREIIHSGKQTPHGLTRVWNLGNQINSPKGNTFTGAENRLTAVRGEGLGDGTTGPAALTAASRWTKSLEGKPWRGPGATPPPL